MANPVAAPTAPGTLGSAPAAPVAGGNQPGQPENAPAPRPATVSVPLFGGYTGGRPRKDGLKPGSPEALAADREKDRLRKARKKRAEEMAAALQPALPAAHAPTAAPLGAGPVVTPGDGGFAPPLVAWEAATLKPLTEQLIGFFEFLDVRGIVQRVEKAKLPSPIVKEVEKDATWDKAARKLLDNGSAKVAAKWLNKSGVSSEYEPELELLAGATLLATTRAKLVARLDKLIALHQAETAKTPPGNA